uniref:Uncharacterized protein n=1 Tax=Ciona savignyi TaxID=51511 RepID=H2Z157_CIOSA
MGYWIFSYVGIATCALVGLKVLMTIIHAARIYVFPIVPRFEKYGKWSVVTGATSGIGRSLAKKLASRGQNIVLISRNTEKLQEVAKEIESSFPVQTKYLSIDFKSDVSIYEEIDEFVKELDIGVLVNNVGMPSPILRFLETENLSDVIADIIKVNIVSVYKMTQIVLPGMVKRKRGLILNISSATVLKPVYGLSIYGATKAMVNYFSKCISREYEKDGITVQSVKPFFVSTNMTYNPTPSVTMVS